MNASPDDMKLVVGVTCESCHGAGGKYRNLHGEGSDRLKSQGAMTERKLLVDAGQNFDMEKSLGTLPPELRGRNDNSPSTETTLHPIYAECRCEISL